MFVGTPNGGKPGTAGPLFSARIQTHQLMKFLLLNLQCIKCEAAHSSPKPASDFKSQDGFGSAVPMSALGHLRTCWSAGKQFAP